MTEQFLPQIRRPPRGDLRGRKSPRGVQRSGFGSVARGADTPASDVDLLVDLADGTTSLVVVPLAEELSALLGIRVDVATVELLRDEIRGSAVTHAIAL